MTSTLAGSCSLDPEIHTALATLSIVKAGKKCFNMMTDANRVCRRLAAQHPLLFLRSVIGQRLADGVC